jgi:hypothetical protein
MSFRKRALEGGEVSLSVALPTVPLRDTDDL